MHDRLVDFERILNFRDFGGWETEGGARVVRGKLYRSASFHDATEADIARLDGMGVSFIVDLRRPDERSFEPNKWPGRGVNVIANDEGPADSLPPHLQALLQSELTADGVASYMREIYRGFAFEPRHQMLYRAWFDELARAEGPAVIHCAAGKDRTGLGCALTLIALGVSEEQVYADYEFTNQAVDLDKRMPRIQARMEERLGRKLNPAALRPMLGVQADYLRAALDAVDAEYGSALNYLDRVLRVGSAERSRLRDRLTD
jgi:protein-tyrosine phosphatase